MEVHFRATETVALRVEEQKIPIQHYLRQPHRLVRAMADNSLMAPMSDTRFRLKMRPLNFMELYHFQPTVVLKVWSDSRGTVYLHSESCEVKGIDYINQRFFLNVTGKLTPELKNQQTYLMGQANLEVKVTLPPPLWLTPAPLLEVAGNGLLKSVLGRIKQRLLTQLLNDYYHWVNTSEPASWGSTYAASESINSMAG